MFRAYGRYDARVSNNKTESIKPLSLIEFFFLICTLSTLSNELKYSFSVTAIYFRTILI